MKPKQKRFYALIGLTFVLIVLVAAFLGMLSFNNFVPSIQSSANNISTIILPHHDLAQSLRQNLLSNASFKVSPKIIILVSPNHFDTGQADVITTDKTWHLNNAVIAPANNEIESLVKAGQVILDDTAFQREHGITNVLSDINNAFTDAKILPLIVKQNSTDEEMLNLSKSLQNVCPSSCLMISSIDFSHDQPGALSEIHDVFSIGALENLDADSAFKAEVDSPQALVLAIDWAKLNNTKRFVLQEETNSGKIAGDPDAKSTSYVLGWYDYGKARSAQSMTFELGGDMMFDRLVSAKFPKNNLSDVVANLNPRFFQGVNTSLVNLEGPIAESYSLPNTSTTNLSFRFPPKTVDVLKKININSVSLANNHTLNGGTEMLANTIAVLSQAQISPIGDEAHVGKNIFSFGDQSLVVFTINSLEVADDLTAQILEAKNAGAYVLVFPHWGNEYQKNHSPSQQKLAHTWIDAGADLVIGSHPHVIQDAEVYKNKPIFYSLGNLLFDQTFSAETLQGLVIAGEISSEKLKLVLLPTVQIKLKPELQTGDERYKVISKLKSSLGLPINDKNYGYDIIELTEQGGL